MATELVVCNGFYLPAGILQAYGDAIVEFIEALTKRLYALAEERAHRA